MKDKPGRAALFQLPKRFPANVNDVLRTGILAVLAGLSAVLFLFLTNLLFERTFLRFAER
ncbi:MAG TPA: hypothetical protein VLQ89_02915 [Candidatus Binatia bacterium]|nr:hypothetical protein [Candidatus Binatia bacterium]